MTGESTELPVRAVAADAAVGEGDGAPVCQEPALRPSKDEKARHGRPSGQSTTPPAATRSRLSATKRRKLLECLACGWSITKAAREIGTSVQSVRRWRDADPEFEAAVTAAYKQGDDVLEDEAIRRGVEGWDEDVRFQGKVVGQVRRYSDQLLILLLKGRMPEKYRERRFDFNVTHTGEERQPTAAELEKIRSEGIDAKLTKTWDVLAAQIGEKVRADEAAATDA